MTILPYPNGMLSRGGGSITVNADGSINVTPATGKNIILQGGLSGAPIAIGNAAYQADASGRVLAIDAVQSALSEPFAIVASNTMFAGDAVRGDQVVMMGHNVNASGGRINPAHGAVWDSWEQYYAQDVTHFYMERHVGVFSDSTAPATGFRTFSMQFDLTTHKTNVLLNADNISYLDMAGTQWFKLLGNTVQLFGANIIIHNTNNTGFLKQLNATASANIEIVRVDAANNIVLNAGLNANGIKLAAPGLGFYNSAPVVKQTVTGSKGANAALTSLMAALVAMGLVTDTTT